MTGILITSSPKKYWMKKYNDGVNFEIKMMEKSSMFPSGKKKGTKKDKNRMKVKVKVVNMFTSKCFWGK